MVYLVETIDYYMSFYWALSCINFLFYIDCMVPVVGLLKKLTYTIFLLIIW